MFSIATIFATMEKKLIKMRNIFNMYKYHKENNLSRHNLNSFVILFHQKYFKLHLV